MRKVYLKQPGGFFEESFSGDDMKNTYNFVGSLPIYWHNPNYEIDLDKIKEKDEVLYNKIRDQATKFLKSNAFEKLGKLEHGPNWMNNYKRLISDSLPISDNDIKNAMLVMWKPMVASWNNNSGFGNRFIKNGRFIGNEKGTFSGNNKDSYVIDSNLSDQMDKFWTERYDGTNSLMTPEEFKQIKDFWDLTKATRLRLNSVQGIDLFADAYGYKMATTAWKPKHHKYLGTPAPRVTNKGFGVGDEHATLVDAGELHQPFTVKETNEWGDIVYHNIYSDINGIYSRTRFPLGNANSPARRVEEWKNRTPIDPELQKLIDTGKLEIILLKKLGGKLKKVFI